VAAPITVGLFVFAILATAAQGGLRPATKTLKPDFTSRWRCGTTRRRARHGWVAKGVGVIALKIREVAEEHRVPMVSDVPFARALCGACDIGDEIPAEFFGAVARVLAFIMMLKSKGSAAGVHTVPDTG
jgi:flagellar biosynthesis protein FlhB